MYPGYRYQDYLNEDARVIQFLMMTRAAKNDKREHKSAAQGAKTAGKPIRTRGTIKEDDDG